MNDAFPLRLRQLKISTPIFSIQCCTIDFMRNIMGKRNILEWKILIFCLFPGDMILYMQNLKDNPNMFRDDKQIQGYRTEIDIQKSIIFLSIYQ